MGTLNARSTRDTLCVMRLSPSPVRPRFRGASLLLACALAPSLSCGGGGGVSFPNLLADPAWIEDSAPLLGLLDQRIGWWTKAPVGLTPNAFFDSACFGTP